jgi:hypothetical protein
MVDHRRESPAAQRRCAAVQHHKRSSRLVSLAAVDQHQRRLARSSGASVDRRHRLSEPLNVCDQDTKQACAKPILRVGRSRR